MSATGVRLKNVEEVWVTVRNEIVVIGRPEVIDGVSEEDQHNCDQMGCGAAHVIFRSGLKNPVFETVVCVRDPNGPK